MKLLILYCDLFEHDETEPNGSVPSLRRATDVMAAAVQGQCNRWTRDGALSTRCTQLWICRVASICTNVSTQLASMRLIFRRLEGLSHRTQRDLGSFISGGNKMSWKIDPLVVV